MPPGALGAPASPGSYGTFDGGYAQVIRATDDLVPPSSRAPYPGGPGDPARPSRPGRPAGPAGPADADVFVYRDTSQPDRPATRSAAREPTEHDAAYWYDLLAEDPSPRQEEARGPFEPLVSSNDPDPAQGQSAVASGTRRETALPDAPRDESPEDAARVRARKLEQLKDLYLTAEAIGEQNVDKHFDQLLAQQRELISEYFRQSAAATPAGPAPGAASAGPAPGVASPRDGLGTDVDPHGLNEPRSSHDPREPHHPRERHDPREPGAGVAAERPGAW